MTPVLLPQQEACPVECPYSVELSAKRCTKVCVSEGRCSDFDPVLQFGDPLTLECVPTCGRDVEHRIPGCSKCSSIGICAECASGWGLMPGYILSKDGTECHNAFHSVVLSVYGVVGVALVVVLYYLIMLYRRKPYQEESPVLEKALGHRARCKPSVPETGEEYSYWGVSLIYDDICGQGVMQYFTWNLWMTVIAAALALGAWLSYKDTKYLDELEAVVDGLACYSSTEDFLQLTAMKQSMIAAGLDPDDPLAKYFDIDLRMFKFLGITYIFILFLSLALSWWQVWYVRRWESNHTGLRHFAVMISGLDKSATSPTVVLEHVIRHSGMDADDFVGVSIAYDIFDCTDDLELLVDNWAKDDNVPVDNLPPYYLKAVDSLLVDCGHRSHDNPHHLLSNLTSSGNCFVVLHHMEAVNALLKRGVLPPVEQYHEQELTVSKVRDEPPAVIWESFTRANIWWECFKAVVVFVGIISLWMMLYLPWAMDYIFYASIPGEQPDFKEDFILGLLIALGNAIVGNVVEMVVGWIGINNKGTRDVTVLYVGFCAVALNTFLDLLVVMEVAKGTSLDQAFEGHRVGYDAALAEGIVAIIIPGYLILPYVVAPIFLYLLPYYLSKRIITSRSVGIREAERALEAPPFDVVPWRYIDFVNNITICLTMLVFTTPASYKVMLTLVFSFILIFFIDRYLLLRGLSEMVYTSSKLAKNFSRLFCLPTGILAGITGWWGVKAGVLPWFAPWAFGAAHCVVYLVLLETCRPVERLMKSELLHRSAARFGAEGLFQDQESVKTYKEVVHNMAEEGKFYSYWNTNAAQCLRYKYLKEDVPGAPRGHLAPYSHGKEMLMAQHTTTRRASIH
jgi:hypothetical protein